MKRIEPKINLNTETTIRTFMIKTIDLIEQYFGEDWGHEKDEEDITDLEEEMYEKFLEIRERILDLGNDLIKEKNTKGNRRKIYG